MHNRDVVHNNMVSSAPATKVVEERIPVRLPFEDPQIIRIRICSWEVSHLTILLRRLIFKGKDNEGPTQAFSSVVARTAFHTSESKLCLGISASSSVNVGFSEVCHLACVDLSALNGRVKTKYIINRVQGSGFLPKHSTLTSWWKMSN